MERTITLRDQLRAGVVAGLAGGLLMELFLLATQLAGGVGLAQALGGFRFIAAVLVGPAAYTMPGGVALGVVLHFGVAVGWALGYVYAARTHAQLVTLPWVSGAGFGLVVYVFMEIVVLTAGLYHRPAPAAFLAQLVAHLVFYGPTVALVVSRLLRRAPGPQPA